MRHLTTSEIERLESNGCRCRDWSRVTLGNDSCFDPDNYAETNFSGDITLGIHELHGPDVIPPVYRASLHDCELGHNVYVQNVHLLAGYTVGDNTRILNCGTIDGSGWDKGGIPVNVLDETGSRSLNIFPGLTAQTAKLAVDNDDIRMCINMLPSGLEGTPRPFIGKGAEITGASLISRSIIGNYSRIGINAIVEESITEAGSIVDKGSQIANCFVGQNVTLSNFCAQHSLFFANSHLCNGEAASVFAGPFTVSEHKSTLLIGAEIMMFNAGSGTNQSNHLYKLGPIHYGSMGRGSKCASDSYIMWPARIGDFTMVSGRHYSHPDTRIFPFSYLIGDTDGQSRLLPAENLCKCGTARDIAKWPARDRREKDGRLDLIDYEALNPHTIAKIEQALVRIDTALHSGSFDPADDCLMCGVKISRRSMLKAKELYTNALMRYFGNRLLLALQNNEHPSRAYEADDEWHDLAGMIMPGRILDRLKDCVLSGKFKSVRELTEAIAGTYPEIEESEQAFSLDRFPTVCCEKYGIAGNPLNVGQIIAAYIKAEEEYLALVLADAAKEAQMAGRPALAENDPTLDALKKRLADLKTRAAALSDRK